MELDNFTSTDTYSNISSESNSVWDAFHPDNHRYEMGWTITFIFAYLLILIVGAIGNLLVLTVMSNNGRPRTVTNMFIINLAVADSFVIAVCVIPTLLANILKPWTMGSFMCKGVAYVQGVSVFASAYSLAALTCHRHKAIYRPMEQGNGLSKLQGKITIFLIWTIAILVALPWLFVFTLVESDNGMTEKCIEKWSTEGYNKSYFLIVNLICGFIVPLGFTGVSNFCICQNVAHREVPCDLAFSARIENMHRQTRQSVTNMLLVVTITFLICWFPLYLLVTVIKFSSETFTESEEHVISILFPIAQLLGISNSCMNPILYSFLSPKFRESFKKKIHSFVCCKRKLNLEREIPMKIKSRVDTSNQIISLPEQRKNINNTEKIEPSKTQFNKNVKEKPRWIRRALLIKVSKSEYALATRQSQSCQVPASISSQYICPNEPNKEQHYSE